MKRFVALALLFGMFASFVGCDATSSSTPPATTGGEEKPATTGAEAK